MSPVRINLDRVSAPLWFIAVGVLAFSITQVYVVVRIESAISQAQQRLDDLYRTAPRPKSVPP